MTTTLMPTVTRQRRQVWLGRPPCVARGIGMFAGSMGSLLRQQAGKHVGCPCHAAGEEEEEEEAPAAAGEPAAAAAGGEQADNGAGPSKPSASKKRKVAGDQGGEGWGKIEEGLSGAVPTCCTNCRAADCWRISHLPALLPFPMPLCPAHSLHCPGPFFAPTSHRRRGGPIQHHL